LVKNPDYFLGAPWLDSVVFRVLPDPLTLQLAFQTKQVDFWNVDPWAVKSFEKDPRFDLFSAPGQAYNYIGWNLRRPLFSDPRVRKALAQAVNVPEMIKYIIYGRGVQSTGIFTPQMWFFDPSVMPLPYDPAAARTLLEEAGWKVGPDGIRVKDGKRFTFTLLANNGNEVRRDIATLVQDDLKRIGIEVKVEIYEWAVLLKRFVSKGEFDSIVMGWGLGYDFDQYAIWHSSQTHPEELNFIGYANPTVDHLLTELRQEYARPEIIRLAGKLQKEIYADQPYLFLFVPESTSVMWKDSYRIRRPGPNPGEWIDSPVTMTKAGWSYDMEWFYRPEYPPGAERQKAK
jgi:peptide/nickel transport system substrate-binding protein